MVNLRTNCVQDKEEIEDFTCRVSDCEELVGVKSYYFYQFQE